MKKKIERRASRVATRSSKSLYNLLDGFRQRVEDEGELGILVGLCVVEGLGGFTTTSRSDEEVRFQQVKKVYGVLEGTLVQVKEQGPYRVQCDLQRSVRGYLDESWQEISRQEREKKKGREKGKEEKKKEYRPDEEVELFGKIVRTMDGDINGYLDHLRRDGLALLEAVTERGTAKSWNSTLENDYLSIESCFVKGGWEYGQS